MASDAAGPADAAGSAAPSFGSDVSRGQAVFGPRWMDAVARRAGKSTMSMIAAVGSTQSGSPTDTARTSKVSKRSQAKTRYPTTTCQRDLRCSSPISFLSAIASRPFPVARPSFAPRVRLPSTSVVLYRFDSHLQITPSNAVAVPRLVTRIPSQPISCRISSSRAWAARTRGCRSASASAQSSTKAA